MEGTRKRRFIIVSIILAGLIFFYYCDFYHYLNFETLKSHQHFLLQWTQAHYFKAIFFYISLYTLAVLLAMPGIVLFTLAGGFLFGIWQGIIYDLMSVT